MAFPAISNLNHTPFFQNAIQQNKVASGVFALYLAESGSELHLGGTNPRHYSGPIEYHPVIKTEVNGTSEIAFWQLGDAEVGVNGKSVPLSPFQTIIDSGTTLMYGPPDEVEKVYAQVEGSKALTGDLEGFYSFPCDKVPKISFKWGNGKAWTISDAK
jgi:cathepsin D